jgi:glycosyltransferase involved in cell wall biosynthesis
LVGNGEARAAIEKLVTALGLDGRVEFSGFRPEPAPDLRAADVVVIPSRYDGMALTLLEAMACGTAIVATRVPGTSALGGAGQLVPVEDPESLAEAVDALLADPQRRRLLGAAARERAVKHYSLQRSLRGILELWQGLGARPGTDSQNTESLPDDTLVEKKTN